MCNVFLSSNHLCKPKGPVKSGKIQNDLSTKPSEDIDCLDAFAGEKEVSTAFGQWPQHVTSSLDNCYIYIYILKIYLSIKTILHMYAITTYIYIYIGIYY